MASVVVERVGRHRFEVRLVGELEAAQRYAHRIMDDDPDRLLLVLAVDVAEDASVADVLAAVGLD